MNILTTLSYKGRSRIALFLIIIMLATLANWPILVRNAKAAPLTYISDTLSDSDLGVKSNHTLQFITKSAVTASNTIVIAFTSSFSATSSPAFANSDATDYDIATTTGEFTVVAAGACVTTTPAFEITSINTSSVTTFTFTHCNGSPDLPANTTTTIQIGTNATTGGTGDSQLVNPAVSGSYVITITAPSTDSASTRVAIIDDIVVTASVATNFTFTISGVVSGQANANGEGGTTIVTTTATTIPWGELSSGVTSTARQDLAVSTNARNGFTVTIWQDQNLLSSIGADIDIFQDGVNGSPTAWASPAATIDSEDTYGHEGITSEDATLAGGDTFGAALYDAIGTQSAPLEVFFHTGPANGTTANKGATKIGFKIEISALQEAATDYTQSLTYIATPIF
jgi:hypothetical protein